MTFLKIGLHIKYIIDKKICLHFYIDLQSCLKKDFESETQKF